MEKKQYMFMNKGFRQCYCIYSTSERYSLKRHLKVRRLFLTVQERFSPEHSGGMATASIQVKELSGLGMASCEWIIIGVKKAIG
jgi:hypothetical protein